MTDPRPIRASAPRLAKASFDFGVQTLVSRDSFMANAVERYGPPPLWTRPEGFATLVHIILEQQVSLASAAALFHRLEVASQGRITPAAVSRLGTGGLQAQGVTRQKARYIHGLAEQITGRRLSLSTLRLLTDTEVEKRLTQVPGIGLWTARIYLLMALRRPDIWPTGDLALHRVAESLLGSKGRLRPDEVAGWAERWRPWRAVAARILWHAYLSDRGAALVI